MLSRTNWCFWVHKNAVGEVFQIYSFFQNLLDHIDLFSFSKLEGKYTLNELFVGKTSSNKSWNNVCDRLLFVFMEVSLTTLFAYPFCMSSRQWSISFTYISFIPSTYMPSFLLSWIIIFLFIFVLSSSNKSIMCSL